MDELQASVNPPKFNAKFCVHVLCAFIIAFIKPSKESVTHLHTSPPEDDGLSFRGSNETLSPHCPTDSLSHVWLLSTGSVASHPEMCCTCRTHTGP